MAFPIIGRKARLYNGDTSTGTVIALTTKSVTINNEPVDITGDGDSGFRTLLADPGTRSLDMSIEGVAKTTDFIVAATGDGSALLDGYTLAFEGVGEIAGDFFLSSVELGAPYNEAVTFTATLASSGAFTFTPEG